MIPSSSMARRATKPIRSTLLRRVETGGKWEARVLDRTTQTDKKARDNEAGEAVRMALRKVEKQ
jgi:hypothetical protein